MKHLVVVLTLFACVVAKAQSPLLDHWFLNNHIINPAISGIESYFDIQAGSRYQWTQIDGGPQSHFLSAHSPLGRPRPKKGFTRTPESLRKDQYNYTGFKYPSHHGVGGTFYFDQLGPFSNTEINLSYAYHLSLSKDLFLSAGLSVGILQRALHRDRISQATQNDPAVLSFVSTYSPQLRPGLWLYGDKFYAGVSVTEFFNIDQAADRRTAVVTAGYRFDSQADGVHFTPYAVARINRVTTNYDLGLKVDWQRLVFAGVTYRSTREAVLHAGISANFHISVAYLYTVGSSQSLTPYGGTTNEILLQLRLRNKEDVPCPQKMW